MAAPRKELGSDYILGGWKVTDRARPRRDVRIDMEIEWCCGVLCQRSGTTHLIPKRAFGMIFCWVHRYRWILTKSLGYFWTSWTFCCMWTESLPTGRLWLLLLLAGWYGSGWYLSWSGTIYCGCWLLVLGSAKQFFSHIPFQFLLDLFQPGLLFYSNSSEYPRCALILNFMVV